MRFVISALSAIVVSLGPIAANAANQFVTMESVRFEQGSQVVTSLSAGNDLQVDEEGVFSFQGQAVSSDGIVTPVVVRIQSNGLAEAPTIDEFVELTGRMSVTATTEFNPSIDGVEIEKTIYTLIDNETMAAGAITLTDDPLPAVVGWLLFAGVASFTGLSATIIITCSESGGTPTASMSAELLEGKGGVSVTCEPRQQ